MSILSDITYGKDFNGQSARAISTPAKLKLRGNTFNGIKSLQARNSLGKSVDFAIPNAYMAMDSTGSEGGSGISVNHGSISEFPLEYTSAPKKLKVKESQMNFDVNNVSNENEFYNNYQNGGFDVSPAPAVDHSPVMMNNVMDSTRDRIFTTAIDHVQHAENMDSFAKLRQATAEYGKVNDGLKAITDQVETKKRDLDDLKHTLSEIGDGITREQRSVQEVMEAIGVHERETAEIQSRIGELNRKFDEKILQIDEMRRQREAEKRKKEEEDARCSKEQDECRKDIEDGKIQIEELVTKREELEKKAQEALETREQTQKIFEEKQNLYNAISLPTLVREGRADIAENMVAPSVVTPSSSVVSFPTPVADVNTDMDMEGSSMVRSIGKAA